MRSALMLTLAIVGCVDPPTTIEAARQYNPKEVQTVDGVQVATAEIEHWDSSSEAAYGEKLFQENFERLAEDPRVLVAHKRGMVNALLTDRVEKDVPQPTDEEIESRSPYFRSASIKPRLGKFSAISIFSKKVVNDIEQSKSQRKATMASLVPLLEEKRLELVQSPTQETLQRISTDLTESLPDSVGVAIRTDSRVLLPGAPDDKVHLYLPALAMALDGGIVGDVPSLVSTGYSRMIVIHEGFKAAENPDPKKVKEQAVASLLGSTHAERLGALLKEAYAPADVKFHPKVVSDRTTVSE